MKNCLVETTIKPLNAQEFIGYISFSNPFQNIYCEISESREKLRAELDKRVNLLQTEFLVPHYDKVEHIHN